MKFIIARVALAIVTAFFVSGALAAAVAWWDRPNVPEAIVAGEISFSAEDSKSISFDAAAGSRLELIRFESGKGIQVAPGAVHLRIEILEGCASRTLTLVPTSQPTNPASANDTAGPSPRFGLKVIPGPSCEPKLVLMHALDSDTPRAESLSLGTGATLLFQGGGRLFGNMRWGTLAGTLADAVVPDSRSLFPARANRAIRFSLEADPLRIDGVDLEQTGAATPVLRISLAPDQTGTIRVAKLGAQNLVGKWRNDRFCDVMKYLFPCILALVCAVLLKGAAPSDLRREVHHGFVLLRGDSKREEALRLLAEAHLPFAIVQNGAAGTPSPKHYAFRCPELVRELQQSQATDLEHALALDTRRPSLMLTLGDPVGTSTADRIVVFGANELLGVLPADG